MIIPTGYGQVNLMFTGVDLPTGAECTFGINNTSSGFTPAEVAQLVEPAVTASGIDDTWTAGVTLSGILVKLGPNDLGPSHLEPVSINGTQAGQSVGPNTAFLVHKTTNVGGRPGRGRMYTPGCEEALVDTDGLLNGTTASVFTALWEAFRNALAAADIPMVLLHSAESVLAGQGTPITALAVDARVATQRRRNRR